MSIGAVDEIIYVADERAHDRDSKSPKTSRHLENRPAHEHPINGRVEDELSTVIGCRVKQAPNEARFRLPSQ